SKCVLTWRGVDLVDLTQQRLEELVAAASPLPPFVRLTSLAPELHSLNQAMRKGLIGHTLARLFRSPSFHTVERVQGHFERTHRDGVALASCPRLARLQLITFDAIEDRGVFALLESPHVVGETRAALKKCWDPGFKQWLQTPTHCNDGKPISSLYLDEADYAE